jgi:hypothetical protein
VFRGGKGPRTWILAEINKTMKYLRLFESWNPLSDTDLASARELNQIGVVSDQELAELTKLREIEYKILQYTGVGDLNLRFTKLLKSLPAGLKVGGNLSLYRCTGLESLPAGLVVDEYLSLYDCTGLESLPAGLEVENDLDLTGCTSLKSLPAGLKVGRNIYLRGSNILGELPQGLNVVGQIYK